MINVIYRRRAYNVATQWDELTPTQFLSIIKVITSNVEILKAKLILLKILLGIKWSPFNRLSPHQLAPLVSLTDWIEESGEISAQLVPIIYVGSKLYGPKGGLITSALGSFTLLIYIIPHGSKTMRKRRYISSSRCYTVLAKRVITETWILTVMSGNRSTLIPPIILQANCGGWLPNRCRQSSFVMNAGAAGWKRPTLVFLPGQIKIKPLAMDGSPSLEAWLLPILMALLKEWNRCISILLCWNWRY